MVKLNKIYTRTGDAGTTGLGTGERVLKHDTRVEAYGSVDEANAALGLVRLHMKLGGPLDVMMSRIQNDLFDLGADLCTPERDGAPPLDYLPLRITAPQVAWLEHSIDHLNADLPALRSFVLPAGEPAAVYLHLARTIARRAERQMVALAQIAGERVNPEAIRYINRLSDLLFVAARYVNAQGAGDVLWVPGAGR